MNSPPVKESIVRALSVPFAQQAAPLLVEEFRRADAKRGALKWAIGNALDVVANDASREMIDLATDRSHGDEPHGAANTRAAPATIQLNRIRFSRGLIRMKSGLAPSATDHKYHFELERKGACHDERSRLIERIAQTVAAPRERGASQPGGATHLNVGLRLAGVGVFAAPSASSLGANRRRFDPSHPTFFD